jgi:hypothetical protein
MNEQDVTTLNMFAAAVMPPVGPHDTDAVLAERIKRAFAVADLMLAHSRTFHNEQPVFIVQQPEALTAPMDEPTPILEVLAAAKAEHMTPRKQRTKRAPK